MTLTFHLLSTLPMESRLNRETCDEETRDEANCMGQSFDGILVPSGESYRSGMAGLFLGVDC